ncbi:hypothetical protein [Nocardia crassostreae]|uniref:hypothetical protein n=1 Tax=Nocardia crassostreae TaxID=53428 RepID=UPI00082CDE44|nr:hypothetical protein [Nocardia crassostreae]
MTTARILLIASGVGLAGYGVTLLLEMSTRDLMSVALWLAAGILVHDAVFAPLCAALGVTARRLIPPAWQASVACGAVCTVALLFLAVPVLGRAGAIPGNPTILDRPYLSGLVIALAVIWLLVAANIRRSTPRPASKAETVKP